MNPYLIHATQERVLVPAPSFSSSIRSSLISIVRVFREEDEKKPLRVDVDISEIRSRAQVSLQTLPTSRHNRRRAGAASAATWFHGTGSIRGGIASPRFPALSAGSGFAPDTFGVPLAYQNRSGNVCLQQRAYLCCIGPGDDPHRLPGLCMSGYCQPSG